MSSIGENMIILGLGSNVGDRLFNLRSALTHLGKMPGLKILQVSPVYESQPLLPENSNVELDKSWHVPFLNAAVRCDSDLEPLELLPLLKNIEGEMGRAAVYPRWSPRPIDIDILAWEDKFIRTERLKIPQLNLTSRPFALWPLADIAPFWRYCVPDDVDSDRTADSIVSKWGSRFSGDAPLGTRQINQRIETPQLVGILNVTPDSFSDGNLFLDSDKAFLHAQKLFQDGADIIDIGAESTRPGTELITPATEWQRLEPVLAQIFSLWPAGVFRPKISLDTYHPETAERALEAFAVDWINDVSGAENPRMRELIANSPLKASLVFMHNLGIPLSRERVLNDKEDPVIQVLNWARNRLDELIASGIALDRIIFDPGIGFGKTSAQSFSLIQRAREFESLGVSILFGHSRKSFLGRFTARPFLERDLETAILSNYLAIQKVDYLRVHDVELTQRALKILSALGQLS